MSYKRTLRRIGPVAIKLDQTEVHAPDHDTWCKLSCQCGDLFAVGPNRYFGSRLLDPERVKELDRRLAADHYYHRQHENAYELQG